MKGKEKKEIQYFFITFPVLLYCWCGLHIYTEGFVWRLQ